MRSSHRRFLKSGIRSSFSHVSLRKIIHPRISFTVSVQIVKTNDAVISEYQPYL